MSVKLTTARQAAIDNGIKVLVYGNAGAGKTRLCATAPNPVIISAESGLLSLRDTDIPVIEVRSMADLHDAYAVVSEGDGKDFEWVCLDSLSEIAEVVLTAEKALTKDPRKAYGELSDQMTQLVKAFRDLPGRNVYMSAKLERQKDEATGAVLYAPSMPGQKLGQALPYLFDEVFALRVEKDAEGKPSRWLQTASDLQYLAKDRSGALDLFESPDIAALAAKIRATNPTTNEAN
jgi:hypothetical protein